MIIAPGKHVTKEAVMLAGRIFEGASLMVAHRVLPILGEAGQALFALNAFSEGIQDNYAYIQDEEGNDIRLKYRDGQWGYFDQMSKWVEVGPEAATSYRFKAEWFPTLIRRDLEMSQSQPLEVLEANCLWYLGPVSLDRRTTVPLFFARRLWHSDVWEPIYRVLSQRSGLNKGIILTTTSELRVGYSLPGHHEVLPLSDCLEVGNPHFHLDRNILKARFRGVVGSFDVFTSDYRRAQFGEIEFNFSVKQAAVVEVLHKQGRIHKHQLMVAAGSKQDDPKDLFRKGGTYHPAWGTLIKFDHQGFYWLDD